VDTERAHRGAVPAVILVGYLLILIDVSILMAALPRIHADLVGGRRAPKHSSPTGSRARLPPPACSSRWRSS
jgi:hypothetical protein